MRAVQLYKILTVVALVVLLNACQQPGGNTTGSEYMPDMAHSIAYEANYYNYYYNNTWGSEDEYYKMAMPRKPVPGTVPTSSASHMRIPANGSSDYPYGDSEDERTRATNELINNPYPITDEGLARGKNLYNINCGICHGEQGDGNGYLVRDDGAYPVQPAILINDEFTATSNGRLYHAIIYGKNMMGGYTDKLSTEERWQVVHYVRSLQAKNKTLAYNQMENTLNSVDRPAGEMKNTLLGMSDGGHDSGDHHHDHQGAGHHDDGHDHDGHDDDGHGHDGHSNDDHDHDHGTNHDEVKSTEMNVNDVEEVEGEQKKGLLKKVKEKVQDKIDKKKKDQ